MNNPQKLSTLLAAGILAATAVAFAQDAAPAATPPPAPVAPAASGRRGGPGGPGAGPAANTDVPNTTELAALNKALKDLLSKDPAAKAALDAHPTWNPLTLPGAGRGLGAGANAGGSAGGRRGGGGGAGGG